MTATPGPDWRQRRNDFQEQMRRIQAASTERRNQYGDILYQTRQQLTTTAILRQARMGKLEPDWRDRLTTMDYTALLAMSPGYQLYSDMDTLLLTELRSMPVADWEPNAGADWPRALESWREASHETLDRALAIKSSVSDVLSRANVEQTAVDTIARSQEITALYERDLLIEGSYRAALCVGGQPVDWRGWLRERVEGWPDLPARATVLGALEDPDYHSDWEFLPDYWRR